MMKCFQYSIVCWNEWEQDEKEYNGIVMATSYGDAVTQVEEAYSDVGAIQVTDMALEDFEKNHVCDFREIDKKFSCNQNKNILDI